METSIHIEPAGEKINLKTEILQIALVGSLATFLMFVYIVFGLLKEGFTDPLFLSNYNFYINLLYVGTFGVISFKVIEILTKREWARSIIHDPTVAPSLLGKSRLARNPLRLFLVCIIVFSITSFMFANMKTQFVALPFSTLKTQQIAESAKLYGYTEPAATAETFGLLLMLCTLELTGLTILFRKAFKLDAKKTALFITIICLVILPFVNGFIWKGYHGLRYGSQEDAQTYSFFFGAASTFLIFIIGSMIPAWTWHFFNNFFLALKTLFSTEFFWVYSIIALILVNSVAGLILYYTRKKK